ncbi:hypothetical protein BJ165DRAFT_1427119 [Panaeolus papilionaceus]|nr:hypothetical protein BJ165DRAFT_1427119 [Panaeolus papilionaceus]
MMIFTTSATSFVLTALVCVSQVVAIPVQGPSDDLVLARRALEVYRRSLLDLDELSTALTRRGGDKKNTPVRSNSKSSGGGSSRVTLCKPKNGRKKRSIEELLFPRAHTIASYDPTGAHKVTHILNGAADGLGAKMGGGGSNGEIFYDPTNPNILIKHFFSNGGRTNLDEDEVLTEIDALKAVKQAAEPFKYKYYMQASSNPRIKGDRLYHLWVWMKKMPGTKMAEILATLTDKAKRKTFLDKVKTLVIAQGVHHTTTDKRYHLDITVENVLVVMQGETPQSVNIIDWGLHADGDCVAEPEAEVTKQVNLAFDRFY